VKADVDKGRCSQAHLGFKFIEQTGELKAWT